MPRLLPAEWIKQVAIFYLLQLYEKEIGFMDEWEEVRRQFAPSIEQLGKVSALIDAEELSALLAPSDLFASLSYLQKVRNYAESLPGIIDLTELRESYSSLQDRLAPYVLKLNELAYRWNLRASWAGDELMWRDVQNVEENIFKAAGASALYKLSTLRIQRLFDQEETLLPYDIWRINMFSLYSAGGRTGFVKQFNEKLIEFEKRLKDSGVREPPSALHRHAEWWFDHYVRNISFRNMANTIAEIDEEGGPQPGNIRNAIKKFSELTGLDPVDRTHG